VKKAVTEVDSSPHFNSDLSRVHDIWLMCVWTIWLSEDDDKEVLFSKHLQMVDELRLMRPGSLGLMGMSLSFTF
jgi:hypothetical protein